MKHEILSPGEKERPKIDGEKVEEAIKKLNTCTFYPFIINIGNHIMNSITQDYIEQLARTKYDVVRRMDRHGRYEVLEINYTYKHDLKHKI